MMQGESLDEGHMVQANRQELEIIGGQMLLEIALHGHGELELAQPPLIAISQAEARLTRQSLRSSAI